MRNLFINEAQEKLKRFIRTRYEIIKPIPIQGLFNFKCHLNAVEYNRVHDCAIVETIYIDPCMKPILHYLNVDSKGTFLETSVGYQTKENEYYKIRIIDPNDYMNISNEFAQSLESWNEQFVGWFGRKILRINRII
jgi:hypothetical protein